MQGVGRALRRLNESDRKGEDSQMRIFLSALSTAAAVSLLSGTSIARADEDNDQRNAYVVTPLVSDLKGAAAKQDPVLQNAWGVAFTPAASPFWIADNATGCATLYDADGTRVAWQLSPRCRGGAVPAPDCKPANPITT